MTSHPRIVLKVPEARGRGGGCLLTSSKGSALLWDSTLQLTPHKALCLGTRGQCHSAMNSMKIRLCVLHHPGEHKHADDSSCGAILPVLPLGALLSHI